MFNLPNNRHNDHYHYYYYYFKFLAKIDRKEDACIVLSDSKLDAKLEIYRSIDKSCSRLAHILESYQNCLFIFANEENALGILLKECSKIDKTKAGKIMAITGKSLTQSSHQRIRLYMPLLRFYQEMETFHSRAVDDTSKTVDKLESKRTQYRASLLWMKNISEKLDPDRYSQMDKFRRVQNQVRNDKKAFDSIKMDAVQKIDLLMASRCNLMNQILAAYQATFLETLSKNSNNFKSVEEIIQKEDIYEYEFKALKQLNPLKIDDCSPAAENQDLLHEPSQQDNNPDGNNNMNQEQSTNVEEKLIDVSLGSIEDDSDQKKEPSEPEDLMELLETLFGKPSDEVSKDVNKEEPLTNREDELRLIRSNLNANLLDVDHEDQIASLLGPSEINLMGDLLEPSGSQNNSSTVVGTGGIDLLTNELEDIDNSSYFKSLQRLQI